jgi:uncharacterized protein (TIRG00374 family)
MEDEMEDSVDRTRYLRLGLFILFAAFFAYRHFTLSHTIYLVFAALWIAVMALSLIKLASTKWQGLAANIGISLVFLDLVFYKLDIGTMLMALKQANYYMFIPSLVMLAIALVIRTWRWHWLLYQTKTARFYSLFSSLMIGTAANMVLPARAGEFIRAYFLGRQEKISKTTAFATIVVERIFDGLTILLFLLLVVILTGAKSDEIRYMGYLGAAFYLGVLVGLFLLYFRKDFLVRLIEALLPQPLVVKIVGILDAFLEGMQVMRNGRQLLMVVLLSLGTWVGFALSFWPILLAFDFGAPVPYYAAFLVIAFDALGLTIPGAPAGIGIFQYVTVVALRIAFTLSGAKLAANFDEVAAAFSLVLHFSQVAPEVLIGLYCFLRENVSLHEVEVGI